MNLDTPETRFASIHHREVADAFSDALIAEMADNDPATAEKLQMLRSVIWRDLEHKATQAEKDALAEQLTDSAINDPSSLRPMLEGMLRMGQMYDLAGLVARDNHIDASRKEVLAGLKKPITGGIRSYTNAVRAQFGKKLPEYETAVDFLNKPVFEVVMTAHPTNINAEHSILALHEIGQAAEKVRKGAEGREAVYEGIRKWLKESPLPSTKNDEGQEVPANITVDDETSLIIEYLTHAYEDLPQIYKAYEKPLKELATGGKYSPLDLKLNARFSSWGSSGDKDGNDNVTAETTLRAIALHKKRILDLYVHELHALHNLTGDETMTKWWGELEKQRQDIDDMLRNWPKTISPDEFDAMSARLAQYKPDAKKLMKDLETFYEQQPEGSDAKERALNMFRRVHSFGFHFARIEFRETAEAYERVVAELVPEYGEIVKEQHQAKASLKAVEEMQRAGQMGNTERQEGYRRQLLDSGFEDAALADPQALIAQLHAAIEALEGRKVETLNAVLQDNHCARYLQDKWDEIKENGPGRKYDLKDPMPITYHTVQRMALARDFPEMITANVLAECENTSNLLEAEFLQAASEKGGKRAIMGIVPLFESPEVMQRVDQVMASAYDNEAYRRHMSIVADHLKEMGFSDGKVTQQVQIAHSDNTRRSGLPAARALIYDAHTKIREVNDAHGVKTEFFEGGSNSDPFRGGLRAISAATNAYGLADMMKFTFQGGDMLNYFNYPGSVERLYTRNFSHAAKLLMQKELQPRVLPNVAARNPYSAANATEHERNDPEANDLAMAALTGTLEDYQHNIFHEDTMGHFLYVTKDDHGNISSRKSKRPVASAVPVDGEEASVDPQNIRTITFSESFQHAGVVPTWLGSLHLEDALKEELQKPGKEVWRIHYMNGAEGHALKPELYRELYVRSGVFRDVIDRMAFGVAMSNMDQVEVVYPDLANDKFVQERLKPEYREAARLAYLGLGGPERGEAAPDFEHDDFATIRDAIRAKLFHAQGVMEHKSNFMDVAQTIKRTVGKLFAEGKMGAGDYDWGMSLSHAAIDTVTHGRMLAFDDPTYRDLYCPEFGRQHRSMGNGHGVQ